MKVSKRICKDGSIALPKQIRAEIGLFPGNAVNIETTGNGSVVIKPSAVCCRFCGSPENVNVVENIAICNSCVRKITAKVDVTDD